MLGLSWGAGPDAVRGRLAGLTPDVSGNAMIWPLTAVTDRLAAEETAVPEAIAASDRDGDALRCRFKAKRLVGIEADFGYRFEAIGQNPDTLSDQAMAAIARSEWSKLLHQMSTRYGAPATLADTQARAGTFQIVGWALIVGQGTAIRVSFGHDVRGLAGEISYLPQVSSEAGF